MQFPEIIADQTTVTPTTVSTHESGPSESPNNLFIPTTQVIAIALSVGLVTIAIICTTIIISSCCIIAHKRHQPANMTNNMSDEVVTTPTFTQANVAYNRGNDSSCDNNNTNSTSHHYSYVASGDTQTQNSAIYDYIV